MKKQDIKSKVRCSRCEKMGWDPTCICNEKRPKAEIDWLSGKTDEVPEGAEIFEWEQ